MLPDLAALIPFPILAAVLGQTQAIIAAVVVVALVLIAWKFLKFAFRIALVIAAAIAIFLLLKWAGVL
jgi:hypothetical protein